MAEEFAREVVKRFTGEIASRLGKASALATTAERLNSQRLTKHAFEALMEVEPLIFEATALLNAASIVRRSDREEDRSGYTMRRVGLMSVLAPVCMSQQGLGAVQALRIPAGCTRKIPSND